MSTKTLHGGPGGGDSNLALFLLISVAIHVLLALSLAFTGGASGLLQRLMPGEKEPLIVDVVELPPSGTQDISREKKAPTHYADRSQSVEKETYPAPSVSKQMRKPRGVIIPGEKGKEASKTAQTASKKPLSEEVEKLPPSGATVKETEEVRPTEPQKEAVETGQGKAGTGAKTKEATKKKPDLFLTEDRLNELAKKYEAETQKGEQGKTLQLNTSELRYQKYLITMRDRIQFFWEYPSVASRSGWQGKLRIDFVINNDGTVSDIKVVKSSNYPVLDDAAVTALKLASPFPPFPENFAIESIVIRGSFEYQIMGGPGGEQ